MIEIPQKGIFHLEIVRETDYEAILTACGPGGLDDRISLAGWSGYAQVREKAGGVLMGDLTVVVDQSAADLPTTGDVNLWIPASVNKNWFTDGVWDMKLTNGSRTIPYMSGNVFVDIGVSEAP